MFLVCAMNVRKDKTTGLYSQVPVNDKFIYVPILGTLESMFTNSELSHFFQQVKSHQDGIYKDIVMVLTSKSICYLVKKNMCFKYSYITTIFCAIPP